MNEHGKEGDANKKGTTPELLNAIYSLPGTTICTELDRRPSMRFADRCLSMRFADRRPSMRVADYRPSMRFAGRDLESPARAGPAGLRYTSPAAAEQRGNNSDGVEDF